MMQTIQLKAMTRELCHELYRRWTNDAPQRDGTTTSLHIDSKRRKKLRQKKTALGHAEDDHEDWNMEQKM